MRLALVALCAAAPAAAMAPAAAVELMPHRAVYVLDLAKATSSSGIVDADGAMFVVWEAACEGWTVQQRIRLTLYTSRGESMETDVSFTSWETLDGRDYRFIMRTYRNGDLTEELSGKAHLDEIGGPGEAIFEVPPDVRVALPAGSVFPTIHTYELIQAAEAGRQSLFRVLFDGATRGGAAKVNAIIGASIPVPNSNPPDPLIDRRGWRMRLAFFELGDPAPEPHYELGLVQLDNGVAKELSMEYGDFTIDAQLDRIEALPKPDC